MDSLNNKPQCILIVGSNRLAISVCVCLCKAGHDITLLNEDSGNALKLIQLHLRDLKEVEGEGYDLHQINIVTSLDHGKEYNLVIAITKEDLPIKTALIAFLEQYIHPDVLIAINAESIAVSTLQQSAKHPKRIIGANWVEPAHTTYFLEIVTNETTSPSLVEVFFNTAKELWNKDPYVIKGDKSMRCRLMCALIREAFYLIENNYVTVEDIDRACRNDAGYYLPFSGNFRYMDLMGTYMYGIVMQDLNPELSKDAHVPKFVEDIINEGSRGMPNNKGFYNYEPGEAERWDETFRKFSYKIQHIIAKYSHIHNKEKMEVHA